MRRYNNLLWEDREQQEYRAAKARFFRLLTIFIALLIATAIVAISNL
jgi:hypothetical protein